MAPRWRSLAGLAQEMCTLWFQFFGAIFASEGYPFKNLLLLHNLQVHTNQDIKFNLGLSLALTQASKYLKIGTCLASQKLLTYIRKKMKKVNKQCLLDTPRTVRVIEKTWQVIVQTSRP